MTHLGLKNFILCILAVAFITSGISPACQFISGGNGFIEICAADGSVQTIAAPDSQTPEQNKEDTAAHLDSDCLFCFAHAHQKIDIGTNTPLLAFSGDGDVLIGPHHVRFKSRKALSFEARAPPRTFS